MDLAVSVVFVYNVDASFLSKITKQKTLFKLAIRTDANGNISATYLQLDKPSTNGTKKLRSILIKPSIYVMYSNLEEMFSCTRKYYTHFT